MYATVLWKEKRPISLLDLTDAGREIHRLAVFTCRVYWTGVALAILGGILDPTL